MKEIETYKIEIKKKEIKRDMNVMNTKKTDLFHDTTVSVSFLGLG